jgi:hypothetical protein
MKFLIIYALILMEYELNLFNCQKTVRNESKNESNFNESNEDFKLGYYFWLLVLSLLYGSISIISIIGNSLIIFTIIRSKRMRNVTNFFICNLALSDIIIGFLVSPFQVFSSFFLNV